MPRNNEAKLSKEEQYWRSHERRKARARLVYAERRKNGLCSKCNDKAVPGFSQCQKHRDRQVRYEESDRKAIIKQKRANGLCTYSGCTSASMPGSSYCGYHQEMAAEKRDARYAMHRESGKCRCGRPVEDGVKHDGTLFATCAKCLESKRKYDRAARARKRAMMLSKEGNDAK